MKFELTELNEFSGSKCAIYSIWVGDDEHTLMDQFVLENIDKFRVEVDDIRSRLENIGNKYGAREDFFKHKEGVPGDGICALYDDPDSNLRLYCIRYGSSVLILGNGGHKPKEVHAFQEVPKLKKENYLLRDVSKWITQARQNGDLHFDGFQFSGEFRINKMTYKSF